MGDGKPKYLNSPETAVFDKSRNLYGLNRARTSRKTYFLLCEGYMDVISLHQAGFTNAVASLGTALTSGHASLIKRYVQEVYLTYDSDDAGTRAALRAVPILREAGISAKVIRMDPYKDPDEFIKNLGAEEYEKRIQAARNGFMFSLEMLEREFDMNSPEGKTEFFREVSRRLLTFEDELERNNYIEAVATAYRISRDSLDKMVAKTAVSAGMARPVVRPKRADGVEKKKEDGNNKSIHLYVTEAGKELSDKHKEFDKARKMLNGALAKYLTDESAADALAQALKIAINSVYGLTSASFENPFHDNRNKDNIVAKRGALFMINLKHEVQKRGFVVAHIKTDSIKIPDATPEIIQFVMDYGKMYGYIFEHEATYDRMCLVNNAVYIAKYKDGKHAGEWTATGTQFQIPYVFKKLFSHEEINFEDMCETKSVTSAIYIDRSPDEAAAYINNPDMAIQSEDNLVLDNGHTLQFIGKVGLFTPIKSGCGGGSLVRQNTDKNGNVKYDSVVGTKDYLWMESEMVKILGKENCIDRRYYDALVDSAATDISKYGDFEWFVSEDPYVSDTPPWFGPGEPHEEDSTPFDVR